MREWRKMLVAGTLNLLNAVYAVGAFLTVIALVLLALHGVGVV